MNSSSLRAALGTSIIVVGALASHGCSSDDSSTAATSPPQAGAGGTAGAGGSSDGASGASGQSGTGGAGGGIAGSSGSGGSSGVAGASGSAGSSAGGTSAGASGAAGSSAGAAGSSASGASGQSGAAGNAGGAAGASGAAGSAGASPLVTPLYDMAHIGSDGSKPDFHVADTTFMLPAGTYSSIKLVADLTSPCFPFSNWKTDPPPSGENWPTDCDAFDRNYEFTLDEPVAMTDPPAVELIRSITPFGGPEHLEVDVTDVLNGLPGMHRLRVTIPTYSDGAGKVSGSNGGWFVSAHLEAVVGPAPHQVLAVTPLFNGSFEMGPDPSDIPFMVPAGTTHARIEYRATGHGGGLDGNNVYPGCIGPAEEFCNRTHTIFVDDTNVFSKNLWRTDCAMLCTQVVDPTIKQTICEQNPCGDIQSVMAPRANWCPGSMTPPELVQDGALATPGMHTFKYQIPNVAMGGTWRISAVLIALGS
jgi:hypothetical protein